MTQTKWEMPAQLKEAGLTEDQCRMVSGYLMLRAKFARQQRNALAGLFLLAVQAILMKGFSVLPLESPSTFDRTFDILLASVVPAGLVLCILVLVMTETIVVLFNRKLANPKLNARMQPSAVKMVRHMGNAVALHTMMFKKMPYEP